MNRPQLESILERMDVMDRRQMRKYILELVARADMYEDRAKSLEADLDAANAELVQLRGFRIVSGEQLRNA